MYPTLAQLREEYLTQGTLKGLPQQLFINGQWREPSAQKWLDSLDPCTGQAFARIPAGSAKDIDLAVNAAQAALPQWQALPAHQRGQVLARTADLLEQQQDLFATVEALEVGKPISEAIADIQSCLRTLRYYAGAADKVQGDSYPLGQQALSFSIMEAVGVTAHIVPWNFPLNTTLRGVAPALAVGCTAVVKPAENTSLTSLMLGPLFSKAGLPDGVYNVVSGLGVDTGAPLVAHRGINHVTFTGSVQTGRHVMRSAAQNISSLTLELGGKSPLVVLADADLEAAADGILSAIFYNAGQICSAGSRLIVERRVHAELLDIVLRKVKQLQIGHSLDNPSFGAISSAAQLDKIAAFVERARARGRQILCGGQRLQWQGQGWFYAPTIIDDVPADDELIQEEIFGPVLSVQIVDDLETAINAANCTQFALAAGIYTRDVQAALHFAQRTDAGQITVNDYWAGGMEVPFGGNRLSGFGREKGLEALRNYCRTKAITFKV
ncbi:aldehyde dehydrogenase family protein [Balneatrix alpica]|uniref:Aldehyde dehydrogenase family protein n=1 Tax=Balneatrix alpica TaxID=75684 RepID=A0ABV5Z7Z2_9GAMM|nr:aldehyde dehydrogenase family protein [Balneatrix alpica]